MSKKTTEWREWTHTSGMRYRTRATYGIDHDFARANNQDPHFSLTGETEVMINRGRWREDSCGQLHDDIAKVFPELAELRHFHLMGVTSGPLHYEANAVFWWREGQANGWDSPVKYSTTTPRKCMDVTIARGALPLDETVAGDMTTCKDADELRFLLRLRLPDLLAYLRMAMERHGVAIEASDG